MKRRIESRVKRLAVLSAIWSVPSAVHACPFCSSTTAQQVRAGIFDADFGYHLMVALAPFVILSVIVALIYFGPAQIGTR